MGTRGVNRIIVAVRDIEKSKKFFSDVLGATFREANWTGASYGIDVAISWDAGIELIAPVAGRENDCIISAFLERNGEGVLNVVFQVDDASAARQRAEAAGVSATHSLDYSQADIDRHLGGLFGKYEEHVLDSRPHCGFSLTLGQIDSK
jgi:catechol 2,3-dioxygenase-like lactoylglutathione lyase family enzyme